MSKLGGDRAQCPVSFPQKIFCNSVQKSCRNRYQIFLHLSQFCLNSLICSKDFVQGCRFSRRPVVMSTFVHIPVLRPRPTSVPRLRPIPRQTQSRVKTYNHSQNVADKLQFAIFEEYFSYTEKKSLFGGKLSARL